MNLGRKCGRSVVLALLVGFSSPVRAADIAFVDDLGDSIPAPLEVCYEYRGERRCETVRSEFRAPRAAFDRLTIEGERHGPLVLREYPSEEEDALIVPRKGEILVEGANEGVSFSLYSSSSESFRLPDLRQRIAAGESVWAPAGRYVASLVEGERAPHLTLLQIRPGERSVLRYERRAGWSLLLRTRSGTTGVAVPGAKAVVGLDPYQFVAGEDQEAEEVSVKTNRDGLAVLSGLASPLVAALVQREGYLDTTIEGISAAPGHFAFREAVLSKGGRVKMLVTLEGEPYSGSVCEILEYDIYDSASTAVVVFDGTANEEGICDAEGVPAGRYRTQVPTPDGLSYATAPVDVVDAELAEITLELRRINLEGTVYVEDEGAPGYSVRVFPEDYLAATPAAEPTAKASTDEDGRYALSVWLAGDYSVGLKNPAGSPVTFKYQSLYADAELDFEIGITFEGVVRSNQGQPIAGAAVSAGGDGAVRFTTADDDGRFSFSFNERSDPLEFITISANAPRFERSEKLEIPVAQARTETIEIILEPMHAVRGVLTSRGGTPVSGAWLGAYAVDSSGFEVETGSVLTQADGGFELPISDTGKVIIFYGGRGCALGQSPLPVDLGDELLYLTCATNPGNLLLRVTRLDGTSLEGDRLLLSRDSTVYPATVLREHLANLGVPHSVDASGQLVVPALEPGTYSLYLDGFTSPPNIAADRPEGYLDTVYVGPNGTTEVEFTVAFELTTFEINP